MSPRTVSLHVLRALAEAQRDGRILDLDAIVLALGVRRVDVRSVVSALHREGLVDALRMRLSLRGFALGSSLRDATLPPLRKPRATAVRAA
jgi:hypothetical protein